jgi:hypothetical protein
MDLSKSAVTIYKAGVAIHLKSGPGQGKSDWVKNDFVSILSAHYGEQFGFGGCMAPTIEAADVRGFLIPTKAADGTPTSFFTRPAIMPSAEYLAAHPRGIYFIDENDSADLLTQKALSDVRLNKRFGDYVLPEGWLVVSASNRKSDKAGVVATLSHNRNRENTMEIDPDVTSWANWAEAKRLHPMFITFAKQRPAIVFSGTVPKDDGPFCTPRSFVFAERYLSQSANRDENNELVDMELPSDPITQGLVAGCIGDGAAAELFSFLKIHDQLPLIADIEKDPKTAKCPEDLAPAYAAMQICLHHARPSNIEKLWQYIERLPKELQVSAALTMIQKSGSVLLNSTSLTNWIGKNKALINVTTKN